MWTWCWGIARVSVKPDAMLGENWWNGSSAAYTGYFGRIFQVGDLRKEMT